MNRVILIILVLPVFLIGQNLYSQNIITDPQKLIADIIEDLSANSENELDLTSIAEDLNRLVENPINLNSCNIDDLSMLSFLTDFQVQSLWEYIQANKPLLNLFELQLVYGFEKGDVFRLAHFIKIEPEAESISFQKMVTKGRHELATKMTSVLETAKGYKNSTTSGYLGNKLTIYTRYNYTFSNKLQWGMIGEKDAGEEFFKGNNSKGFDYLSGYVIASNLGHFKRVVVGDFDVEFGQGLTFWSPLSYGKSTNPIGVRKRARGLKQHSSSNENRFLRGAGTTISYKKFDFTIFGSAKKIDANIVDSTNNAEELYTSLPETGFHRTLSEVRNERTLNEIIAGANLQYSFKKVKTGITFSHLQLNGDFDTETAPSNLFQQLQSSRTTTGVYSDINLKGHFIFGEISLEPDRGEYAAMAGGIFKLASTIDYSIVVRSYSRGYNTLYSSGFAEGSSASNENGIFNGISINLIKGLKISAFVDMYKFPWLKYRADAPSSGHDYFVQADVRLNQNLSLLVKYRYKNNQENFTSVLVHSTTLINKKSQSIRAQIVYTTENNISLQSRFDYTLVGTDSSKNEQGFLFAQDISYDIPKIPLSISMRFSIFDTDSWNARIYTYENDLLYSFSVPANYSKGTRFYLMAKYSFLNNYDLWLRWSQTYYHSLDQVGSGLDVIDGNRKNDLRLMLRIKF